MTAFGGFRARRLVSVASLIFAAAATLATSASPPPPPAISSKTQGTLVVTPEEPVAAIEVAVAPNAAVQDASNADTVVRILAGYPAVAGAPFDPSAAGTIVTVEALDPLHSSDGQRIATEPAVSFQWRVAKGCGPADCVSRYRITAVLVDPSRDEAKVEWSASAETRFGQGGATGSAPPDARLSVSAGEVATVAKGSVVRAETTIDPIRVDADHPTTTVSLEATRPPDDAGPILVLDLPGAPGVDPTQVLLTVMVDVGDRQVLQGWVSSRRQVFAARLPDGCLDPAGCPIPIRLTVARNPRAAEADVSWVLRGVGFDAHQGTPGPFTFGTPTVSTLAFDRPDLSATATGTATLVAGKALRLNATATLDQSDVPQAAGKQAGFLQATLTVTSNVVAGAPSDAIGISLDESSPSGPTGRELRTTGALHDVSCSGRSRCVVTFDLGMGVKPAVSPLEVTWTLEVQYVAGPGNAIPPNARLLLGTTPAPN